MVLKSDVVELRGLKSGISKKGNSFVVVYVESKNGEPYNFYCFEPEIIPSGLKKGDFVVLDFIVSKKGCLFLTGVAYGNK